MAVRDLRLRAERMMRLWRLQADGPDIVTDDALLRPVRRGGAALMLKVAAADGDEARQGALLAAIGGAGAVCVHAVDGPDYLMDRLRQMGPTPEAMALAGDDAGAAVVICGLIARMQAAMAAADVAGLLRPLALDAAHVAAAARAADTPEGLRPLVRWGAELVAGMAGQGPQVALHGDMHHFNAIHDRDRGWLAIDPKGIRGPRLYDYANQILNPLPHARLVHDPARMARVAALAASHAGAEAEEILRWVVFRAVMALCWSLHDQSRDYWLAGLQCAARLAGLRPPAVDAIPAAP